MRILAEVTDRPGVESEVLSAFSYCLLQLFFYRSSAGANYYISLAWFYADVVDEDRVQLPP